MLMRSRVMPRGTWTESIGIPRRFAPRLLGALNVSALMPATERGGKDLVSGWPSGFAASPAGRHRAGAKDSACEHTSSHGVESGAAARESRGGASVAIEVGRGCQIVAKSGWTVRANGSEEGGRIRAVSARNA
jgi:hypothetical protein